MSKEIELLISIYNLYKEGKLASNFNKQTNKMENISELNTIMREVSNIIPEELEPIDAATKMRNLSEVDRNNAIEDNDKVVDLRKEFILKISQNQGALGLTKQLVEAMDNKETDKIQEITTLMKELVIQGD